MQTMTALLRIGGSLEMTVKLGAVTPAEALLLMHIHEPATKDAFEGAVLGEDVERSKNEERARLHERYPQHKGLIDHLFPGRNAADVPLVFADLEDVPLEVATEGRKARAQARHSAEVVEAAQGPQEFPAAPAPARPGKADSVKEKVKAVMGEG